MRPEDYPPQEPFSELGAKYHAALMARPAPAPSIEVQHGDDAYQSIAVYAADKPSGPVLCVIHGGGWTNGYKEWMAFMAPALTARGITMVSLGYRLAPQHIFPAGLQDCQAGIAAAHARVAEVGGDPARIFVGGHSAGGHYTALLALEQNWQGAHGLPLDVIKGALPISGTFYFGEGSGLSMRPRFLGPEGHGPEGHGRDEAASAMGQVHAGAPPFLVAWGARDFPHLARQNQEFVAALKKAGVDVTEIEIADADHLGASYAAGEPDGPWIDAAVGFMETHG